jgi:hypothetical protein
MPVGKAGTFCKSCVPATETYRKAPEKVDRALGIDVVGSGPCGDGIPPVTRDRDWAGAGVSFKRARELDPSNDNVIPDATSLAMNLSGGGLCALLSSADALLTPVLTGHGLTPAVGGRGGGLRRRRRRGQTQRDQQREQKGKHGSQSPLVVRSPVVV